MTDIVCRCGTTEFTRPRAGRRGACAACGRREAGRVLRFFRVLLILIGERWL